MLFKDYIYTRIEPKPILFKDYIYTGKVLKAILLKCYTAFKSLINKLNKEGDSKFIRVNFLK